MVELLLALGAIFLLRFIHPFVVYPLSLLAIRLRCRIPLIGDQAADRGEPLALCFCACNAEWVIEEKMRNLLGLRRAMPNLEILANVDGATDRTAELLGRHAGDIKLHASPIQRDSRRASRSACIPTSSRCSPGTVCTSRSPTSLRQIRPGFLG